MNYQIELWDINDVLTADISRFASNVSFGFELNEAETLSFTVDLDQLEKLCLSIGAEPRNILFPGRTEVKIKRNGIYILGTQVVQVAPTLDASGNKLEVKCDGYLNYFLQRFISKTYSSVDRSQIAWDAIETSQSASYGDFGITKGTLAVTSNSDRTADYDEIKDLITDYTWQQGTVYDFEFTPDKVFNTYLRKGSDKPEIQLVWGQNITSLASTIDASTLANKIIGIGSGIGDARIESIKEDLQSELKYRTREKKVLFNSVSVQNTLDQKAQGTLILYKEAQEIPAVTFSGSLIDLGSIQTGDAIKVIMTGHTYLANMTGLFRINKINVSLDTNFAETITLNFYDPRNGG